MATQHELKTWPEPFAAIVNGSKTFEYRIDDRGIQVGDELVLREWEPLRQEYTGRETTARVGFLLRGPDFGLQPGYVVMSLLRPTDEASDVRAYRALLRTLREPSDAQVERLCEVQHDAYEAAAVEHGWATNEKSQRPWADVPEANKQTMRTSMRAVLAALAKGGA